MFDIPRYKVLKAYNLSREACLDCEDHACKAEHCLVDKAKSNLLDYTNDEERLKEKFIKEDFDFTDDKEYDKEKLEEVYEAIKSCCQHCGTYHTEKCFINNTREAVELILFDEIILWDGFEFEK
jgi:hypothetical protein